MPPSQSKTLTWDNLNTTTTSKYDKKLIDGVFNQNMFLNFINAKKKTYDGGVDILVPVENDTADGSWFANGFSTFTPAEKQIATMARFIPRQLEVHIAISRTEMLQNSGEAAKLDLLDMKYGNAQKSMKAFLTTGLFNDGTTANAIGGVRSAVADTPTNTYAGIDRSVAANSYWVNQTDNVTTGVTGYIMSRLQTAYSEVTDDIINPDIIPTTDAIYNQIYSIANDMQRNGNEMAKKLGMKSIDFNDTPILVDKNCPASHLYMLNTDYIYLMVHKDDDMVVTPFLVDSSQPFAKVKYISWTGQLVCSNPRYQQAMYT